MLKSFTKIFSSLLILVSFQAFAADLATEELGYRVTTGANEIKIMSYNAENLFDTEHDMGKKDFEFLPKNHPKKIECEKDRNENRRRYCLDTDWTSDKLAIKISQLKKAVEASGSIPDVLTLTEVENKKAVQPLATALGYDGVLITNSPDARGIDNVILYKREKLTYVNFVDREVVNPMFPTRNLSVAHFRLKRTLRAPGVIGVYPNHWPSQASPTKSRLIVAEQLVSFIAENKAKFKGEDYYSVVVGDFNTITADIPSPIDDVLLSKKTDLIDVKVLSDRSKNPMNGRMPPASYFYVVKSEWNELDRIFVSENLADGRGVEVDAASYRIHAPKFLTKVHDNGEMIPFRYNHRADKANWAGYSDHFALVVKLRLN